MRSRLLGVIAPWGWFLVMGALALAGCGDDDTVTGAGTPVPVRINMFARSGPGVSFQSFVVEGVELTEVKFVIEEIELEREIGEIEDFKFEEPFIADLDLGGGPTTLGTFDVPPGLYEELEIKVAKLPDDHPSDMAGLSIRIRGNVIEDGSSAPFTFTSDLDEEQETELEPPLVVTAGMGGLAIALVLDTSEWFRDQEGDFLDPRDPANGSQIEENIKNSIDAFEDEDEDGEPGAEALATFQDLVDAVGTEVARLEIDLSPGTLVALEVEFERGEALDEEEIESAIQAITVDEEARTGTLTLRLGGLTVEFAETTTEFEGEESELTFDQFIAQVREALEADQLVPVEAKRPPPASNGSPAAQAPDDPTFAATELELEDDLEDELEVNVTAGHLSAATGGLDGTITVFGLPIEVRTSDGTTRIELED